MKDAVREHEINLKETIIIKQDRTDVRVQTMKTTTTKDNTITSQATGRCISSWDLLSPLSPYYATCPLCQQAILGVLCEVKRMERGTGLDSGL